MHDSPDPFWFRVGSCGELWELVMKLERKWGKFKKKEEKEK